MKIKSTNMVAWGVLMIMLVSCNSQPNKKALTGAWVMESLKIGDYDAFGNQLGKPEFLFYPSGVYEIDVAGQIDTGSWKLSDDTVLLMKSFTDPEKKPQTLHIQEITETKMRYKSSNETGQTVFVELIRL